MATRPRRTRGSPVFVVTAVVSVLLAVALVGSGAAELRRAPAIATA